MSDSEAKKSQERKEAAARIALCVKALKGDRTMRQLSLDTGVATSYISSILKGENVPSIEVMKKLTDPASKPQNGVGVEDLLAAAGLVKENASYISDEEIYDEMIEKNSDDKGRRSEQMRMLVCGRLLASGIAVQIKEIKARPAPFTVAGRKVVPGMDRENSVKGNIRFTLQVQNVEDVDEWTFYSLPNWNDEDRMRSYNVYFERTILPRIMCVEPDRKRCTTLIFDDEFLFNQLLNRYKGRLCYRGNLSIVWVDVGTYEFKKEEFITLYDEEIDKEKMSLMAL